MDWLEIKEFLKDTLKIVIFVVVILFIIQYVFSVTKVVGNSMHPTLKDEELFILSKFNYRFTDVKRGDIISLKYANTKYLIKRVIGLPGENVYIKDSTLFINNEKFEESYINKELEYDDFYLKDLGYDKIPEGMYLVLGDNRVDSLDSREIGLISKKDIIGKIAIRFWPLNRFKFI